MSFPHVYVHVPFCARRCTYCDFAIAVRPTVPVREYLDALAAEVGLTGDAAQARTLYLGGGTPSLLGGEGVAGLARIVRAPEGLEEFTLEANPDDVTKAAVLAWRAAGVTRLSIGVQSFDPAVLAWMHRTHAADAAQRAVDAAREAGIPSISVDLIFALPTSLGRSFGGDLRRALALQPDHISLYGLTVEPGTPLGKQVAHGAVHPVSDARYAEEYRLAHEELAAEGFRFYEVSNAARPGHEAIHNAAYWRGASYLGLGPSAHSFDGSARWWNAPAYSTWLRHLASGESPVAGREVLDEPARRLERVYLGLRTAEGADLPANGVETAILTRWVNEGWAQTAPVGNDMLHVKLTTSGWLRLDELVASI